MLDVLRRITETVEEIPQEHRRRVAPVLNGMLGDADKEVRRMAHLAMLAITGFPDLGRDFGQASQQEISATQRRLTDYWSSIRDDKLEKRANALLRRGDSLHARGDIAAAQRCFQRLMDDYPFTEAGECARSKLSRDEQSK